MNKAIKFLMKNYRKELTPELVCLYNRMVVIGDKGLYSGKLRETNVWVRESSYLPPSFDKLPRIFGQMFEDIFCVQGHKNKAISYLLGLSKNQFFIDGNKRTARLACLHQLAFGGQKLLSPSLNTNTYMKSLLTFYEQDDPSQFVEFFKENLWSMFA